MPAWRDEMLAGSDEMPARRDEAVAVKVEAVESGEVERPRTAEGVVMDLETLGRPEDRLESKVEPLTRRSAGVPIEED